MTPLLVLVNGFGPPFAEAGNKNVAELARRIRDRFEVTFFGLGSRSCEWTWEGLRVVTVASPSFDGRLARVAYPAGVLRLLARGRDLVREQKPRLIVGAMETASSGLVALALRRISRLAAPVVQWFWSDLYDAPPGRRHWMTEQLPHLLMNGRGLSRRALRSVDAVLASSRHLERRAQECGAGRVHFAPQGVDLDRFGFRAASNGGPLRVAYVGHLTWAKGVPLLVDAMRPLLDAGTAELDLAASSETGEDASALDSLRSHPRVRLHGLCDPAERLASADVTVLPRRSSYGSASWPNVLLESLACGTPVVTSAIAGVDEIVRDGENGFLLPAGNGAALAATLARLAAYPELVRSRRAAARASVAALGWNDAAARIGDVLEHELERTRR